MALRFYQRLAFKFLFFMIALVLLYRELVTFVMVEDFTKERYASEVSVAKGHLKKLSETLDYMDQAYASEREDTLENYQEKQKFLALIDRILGISEISDINQRGFTFLLDKEGTFLIHSQKERIGRTINCLTEEGHSLHERILNEVSSGARTYQVEQNRKVVVLYNESFDWYLGSVIVLDDIDSFIQSKYRRFELITLPLMIVVIGFGYWFLRRRFIRPIEQLNQLTHKAAMGDLDARADEVIRNDEIGELNHNFNTMIETIRSSVRDLDAKVKARTKEIAEINAHLEERVLEEIEARSANERMMVQQSKNAAMGEMMSNIAHQWRQPLSLIDASVSELRMDSAMGVLDEGRVEKICDDIHHSIHYLSDTIDDFRNFFRPEKQKEIVSIKEIISRSERIVGKTIEKRGVEYSVSGDIECCVELFPNEAAQVIINILKNALDELQAREVQSPRITLNVHRCTPYCIIEIEDSAGGIDEGIIEKVFDPYFSTKNAQQGTGLGLYMSRQIIERHCLGTIEVVNHQAGACFKITLPLKEV